MADSLIMLVRSLDHALMRGLDYEDPYILRDIMSAISIEGATTRLRI